MVGAVGTEEIRPLSRAQEEAWAQRILPGVEEVAEGVWAIAVPIPHNPLVYTYCYVIAADSGIVLIDTGWDSRDGARALSEGLESLGFTLQSVIGVVITHYHRDHLGLVPYVLGGNPQAWVAMHPHDITAVESFRDRQAAPVNREHMQRLATRYGLPDDRRGELDTILMGKTEDTLQVPDWTERVVRITDGEPLPVAGRRLEPLWTPGHTYGHTAFRLDEAFFSGDHILPSITPNVGLDGGAITHSLGDYLGSLNRMQQLPAEVQVLPSHGFRFSGVRIRAGEILAHHDDRLGEIRDRHAALETPTVYDIAAGLHWARGFESLRNFNLYATLCETAAHMYYLNLPVGETTP